MSLFKRKNIKDSPVWGVNGFSASDVGKVRNNNEDSIYFKSIPGGCIGIVADGMGGHAAGEVASKMAIETIVENLPADFSSINEKVLQKLLTKANKEILKLSRENRGMRGMGCTTTMIASWNAKIFWAHVGDSRFYMRRGTVLRQITTDHSLDNLGGTNDGQSHILIRAMGLYDEVEIDTGTIELNDDIAQRILLCSDGLYDMLNNDEINDLLRIQSAYFATNCLIAMSNLKGGHDNVSVIVADFKKIDLTNSQNITKEITLPL